MLLARVPGQPCTPQHPCSKTHHWCSTALPSALRDRGEGDGYFLLTLPGTGQSWLFLLSLFLSVNICLNLPNSQGWRVLGDFPPYRTDTIFWCLFAMGSGCRVLWGEEWRPLPVRPALQAGACPAHQPCLFAGSSHRAGLESVRSQALGKGFEEQCVPEKGNRWSVHPGEQL